MKRREFLAAGATLTALAPLPGWTAVLKGVGDLTAKSLDGADITLRGSSVADFASGLRGELLLQGDPAYDARRRIWNGMFDRKPTLIACCSGAADVRRAVDFARDHRLLTAVRAGGHSFSGKSSCDGGLVIDLQSMRGVRVDPAGHRAYLEAGSLLGELDHECATFGLATTAGTVSHTGAAGLTLGGGFGRLGRRFGLACDNVASFDVVTADGRFLKANDEENPDLYWGLRGGGGNFGVVTAIEYRVHPMNPVVLGGIVEWPIAQAREVLRFYRNITPTAPEALYLATGLASFEDGPVVFVEACWSGDHAEGEPWIERLRAFGSPDYVDVGARRYVDVQRGSDQSLAAGQYRYAKNGFLRHFTDDGIDLLVDVFQRDPALFVLVLDPCDGAYHRVAPDATAFPNRDAMYWLGVISNLQSRDAAEGRIAKVRAAWKELEHLTHGFYTNVSDVDAPLAAYRENYGANLERLMGLKARHDPMNLFRLNANVPPKT